MQTVTTNVPGPPIPLYLLGRKLRRLHPYVPIGDSVHISVAILSYLGRLSFGITADPDAVPDLDVLTKGIRRGPGRAGIGRGGRPAVAADGHPAAAGDGPGAPPVTAGRAYTAARAG